ncbi:type IV pilus assembly protein PilM [Cellulomonas dongxiuzhuiae]|uniref:Type IV pilus assembly protein PilM n=1 Tax=Cellulomonas dongxiuzhuiae TaxID=2819979 RepID=A0ABX8GEG6_9CELL|nr:type IV pilus assembly protein PilM [Cellulomonas dongxiuzhuiae]MBO3087203.1 type IV pilus assembly protein PilM [Cellulomonas dongxiuzhuiae]MBO3090126.1 type IV pilus assembly protein PilM [Cellulomonas dongxiuzhuiae]MBO3093400.1 type IV pilus assembly protein PilM [Cellulomonas dongxiuzhuiae]QWC14544.1 type IV pilus assembly protein PilM [Cellulomonas dongxiuzhuiae]
MAASRVIGLDIGTTMLRAAELEFGKGTGMSRSASLVRYAEAPLPAGAVRDGEVVQAEIVSTTLRQLWSKARFGTKDVVIGVGNQRVLVREFDLPWLPDNQIKQALPFHVQGVLPMSTDDALLDFLPISEFEGRSGRTLKGMLVAAQRDTVNSNVLAVVGAGLSPTMVDLNAFALLRSVCRGELAGRTVAVVDVGANLTHVVVSQAGVPRLARTLPSGGQAVTDAVASAAGIGRPEAEDAKRALGIGYNGSGDATVAAQAVNESAQKLLDAVRGTIGFYSNSNRQAPVEAVLLTGGGADLPGFGQYLATLVRLPVQGADVLAGVRVRKGSLPTARGGGASVAALPIGLAYGVAA